eukprot:5824147-Lingulodinium_polyedra.AAC.1
MDPRAPSIGGPPWYRDHAKGDVGGACRCWGHGFGAGSIAAPGAPAAFPLASGGARPPTAGLDG